MDEKFVVKYEHIQSLLNLKLNKEDLIHQLRLLFWIESEDDMIDMYEITKKDHIRDLMIKIDRET